MHRDRRKEALLLDYYGCLLTSHQQSVLEEYFNEDLSMNEIADNLMISKSAVADLVKRSIRQLEEYEDKLALIRKDEKMMEMIDGYAGSSDPSLQELIQKIKDIQRGG